MQKVIFNPAFNKKPRGASVENEEVCFTLALSNSLNIKEVKLVVLDDKNGDKKEYLLKLNDKNDNYEFYNVKTSFSKGIKWYHFEIKTLKETLFVNQSENFDAYLCNKLHKSFTQIVTKKTSDKSKKEIYYHIFVDRFCKSGMVRERKPLSKRNDWGGAIQKNTKNPIKINQEVFCGNLKGIREKLDYLKSLGVTLIYLSPIFMANSYHKYDTADYMKVDPMFGGDNELKGLIDEAKEKGIKILLDGVFNHTGSDSLYFNKENRFKSIGAFNSKDSKFYSWYNFTNYPNKYDSWWGIETLPAVNENCESYVDFICGKNGVLEKWMNYGIKGFRLDVVDELNSEFLCKLTAKIRECNKEALVIGEVWEDASIKTAYGERRQYFVDDQIDSVMNYPLKNGILKYILSNDESLLKQNMYMLLDHYPQKALNSLMNVIGTHDSKRVSSVIEERTKDKSQKLRLFKIATLLQYVFPGNPCIFYGDERDLKGGEAPLCRICFDWKKENTEHEQWYRFLAKIRNEKAFKGSFNIKHIDNGVVVLEWINKNEKVVFVTNLSEEVFVVELDKAKDLLHNKSVEKEYAVPHMDIAILKIKGEGND